MTDNNTQGNGRAAARLDELIAADSKRGSSRRWWYIGGAVVVLALGGYLLTLGDGESNAPRYLTEAVSRDALVVKVTATGNLEPTNQVDVGSELSGTVVSVFVDDDDHVSKGQVLSELDRSTFEDAVKQSQAELAVAQANLKQAQATVAEAKAKLNRYREVARLSDNRVPSRTEMETAEAEYARAEADVASAQASIAKAQAVLNSDETNLGKTSIRSPIDGVVLERDVDPGQAVAASLQAVTLFTLAEDLSQMELKVDVDEADVGQVNAGLSATFTVDAWPDREFEAVITRVGYNATDDDGVISYPAVLKVDNGDLSLRPGMTGTAEIVTIDRQGVLLVPNAALRFTPPTTTTEQKSSTSVLGALMPRPPRSNGNGNGAAQVAADGSQQVWILRDGQPQAVSVRTGATNGRVTEVLSGDLQEGEQVITEQSGG